MLNAHIPRPSAELLVRTDSYFRDPSSARRRASRGLCCLLLLLASAALVAPAAAAPSEYRLVGAPVVVYHYPESGNVYFDILVRTNRALPRQENGSIVAGARVDGYGPDLNFTREQESVGGFSRGSSDRGAPYCYSQTTLNVIAPPTGEISRPRAGRRVRVDVYIKGQDDPLSDTVELRRGGTDAVFRRARRDLGCTRSARDLVGERLTVASGIERLELNRRPNEGQLGGLRPPQTFTVRRLSPSGKYAYGFAYGTLNKHGWVRASGLEASASR